MFLHKDIKYNTYYIMSLNELLLQTRKDSQTIKKTVITNIIKMIKNRKWISGSDDFINNMIDKLNNNDDDKFEINLDISLNELSTYEGDEKDTDKNFNGKKVMILLLHQKISGLNKSPAINDFLNTYKNYHKILIVDSITDKTKQMITNYKHTEIFTEDFFMLDLMEHVCSPKYEILSNDEAIEFLESYKITKKKEIPKMYDIDPASKYYYMKRKQIVRIIRNSEMTGESVFYRVIVHKGSSQIN